MKYLFILLFLLPVSFAWSLEECPGSPLKTNFSDIPSSWHNCEGTISLTDKEFEGDKYVGEWKDGTAKGQGTYYYLADNKFKGDKYVGEFKGGLSNGQGTYTWAHGEKYVGEWKDDKREGQGTNTFADGRVWVGQWKDDKWVRGKKYAKGEYKGSVVADNNNRQNRQNQEAVERERKRSSEERRKRERAERDREQLEDRYKVEYK